VGGCGAGSSWSRWRSSSWGHGRVGGRMVAARSGCGESAAEGQGDQGFAVQRAGCDPRRKLVQAWFGGICGRRRFRFVDVLAKRIIAEEPDVVSLQEVCTGQLSHLVDRIRAAYPMEQAAKSLHPHVDCPVSENDSDPENRADGVGTAILTVGGSEPAAMPSGIKLLCAKWVAGGRVLVCTAHVDPLPKRDIPDIARTIGPWADQVPVIVTGDFNAQPQQDSMSPMYSPAVAGGHSPSHGRFYEAGMCHRSIASKLGDPCGTGMLGRRRAGDAAVFLHCEGAKDHPESNDFVFVYRGVDGGWARVGRYLVGGYAVRTGATSYATFDTLHAPEDRMYHRTVWQIDLANPNVFRPVAHGPDVAWEDLPQDDLNRS
jgi:hypothetical protein